MDTQRSRSTSGALLSVLVGLGVSAALAGTGTAMLVRDDHVTLDSPTAVAGVAIAASSPGPDPTADPTTTPRPTPRPEPDPTASPVPEPTATATADPAEPTPAAGGSTPAESRAVLSGGRIRLEGAVPSREAADEIVALAVSILGPDNVIDHYVIDPAADDPDLGNITVEDTIVFETNSAVIAPEFVPLLQQALALMTIRPSVTLTVIGHADSTGNADDNLELSTRRARAVVSWLIDHGIDRDRLTAIGRGDTEPIDDNGTAQGRANNRRIQVYVEHLLAD